VTARLLRAAAAAACAASVLCAAACRSSAGPASGSGECAAMTPACSQCTQTSCPDDWTCIYSTCGSYWPCICACPRNDVTCFAACQVYDTAACAACMATVGGCEIAACPGSCDPALGTGSPVGGLACSAYVRPTCANPSEHVMICYYGEMGTSPDAPPPCTSAYYTLLTEDAVDPATFPCASCLPEDLASCNALAVQACLASGDGGADGGP
jgi:hypothetical protein